MSTGEEEVDVVSPLNTTGADGGARNAAQPTVSSQPVASTTRTVNTQPSGPHTAPSRPTPAVAVRAPPGATRAAPAPTGAPAPASRPRGPARPPDSRPVGPTRVPGPVRGTPRPNPGPGYLVYKIRRVSALRRYCVPITTAILVLGSLAVIGILIKVILDNYYFFCSKSVKFIPLDKWCDGISDCSNNEDELRCVERVDYSNSSIVRLTDANSVVQIFSLGRWSTICYDGVDDTRAKAVCAQLGYSSNPTFSFVSASGMNAPFGTVRVVDTGVAVDPISGTCPSGSVLSLSCIACGANHEKQRIIGGQNAAIEESPWQAGMQYMGQLVCGASILNPRMVLSAAHCFKNNEQQVEKWRVMVGSSTVNSLFMPQVEKIFIHRQYSLDQKTDDIAILKLKSDLKFSASIQAICLPGYDINLPDNAPLKVTGWGHTVEGATSLSPTLQKVNLNLISSKTCNQEYFGQIRDTMICAGMMSGGYDTCQGDSGGPLVYLGQSSHWLQVGIVSWGDGCGRPDKPGVYTYVPKYLPWIYGVMKSEL